MSTDFPKLHKLLADAGLGSRREIERWIQEGRIVVNGQVAKIGERTSPDSTISLDGKTVWPLAESKSELPSTVWMYHKPVGEVSTRHDPEQRPTVFDHLPHLLHQRWISVGRLDMNTSGLLLFTTDGALAQRLTHPSSEITREYHIRVYGKVGPEICERLLSGVMLEDGKARFLSLELIRGEGANQWYCATLAEGRNREVRRLWESQGVNVNRLIRVGFGPIHLPDDLPVGEGRFLTPNQTEALYEAFLVR